MGAGDGWDDDGAMAATSSDEGTWSWLEPPLAVGLAASEDDFLPDTLSAV